VFAELPVAQATIEPKVALAEVPDGQLVALRLGHALLDGAHQSRADAHALQARMHDQHADVARAGLEPSPHRAHHLLPEPRHEDLAGIVFLE
jgi:hypothetical protein